ncbi:MAG: hypothetical protein H7843_09090 [Nitrospirota bacterium]
MTDVVKSNGGDMNPERVSKIISEIDEQTGSELMKRYSEEFGFKVVEIEGKVFTIAKELKDVFGYKDSRTIRELLDAYHVFQPESETPSAKTLIAQAFSITPNNLNRVRLINYKGFLTIAINARADNEQSKQVKEVVLKLEREGRFALATGMSSVAFGQSVGTDMDLETLLRMTIQTSEAVTTQGKVMLQVYEGLSKKVNTIEQKVALLEHDIKPADALPDYLVNKLQGICRSVGASRKQRNEGKGIKTSTYEEADYIRSQLCGMYNVGNLIALTMSQYNKAVVWLKELKDSIQSEIWDNGLFGSRN